MNLRLRRALGMLRLGRPAEAAEAALEALEEGGQLPLTAVTVGARLCASGAKSLCGGVAEEEALNELTALKVIAFFQSILLGSSRRILSMTTRSQVTNLRWYLEFFNTNAFLFLRSGVFCLVYRAYRWLR